MLMKKFLLLFAVLLTAVTGAYADEEGSFAPKDGSYSKIYVGVKKTFTVTLTNTSETDTIANHYYYIEWYNADNEDDYGDVGNGYFYTGTIAPGETKTYDFSWAPTKAGTFYLSATNGNDEDLYFDTDEFTVAERPLNITVAPTNGSNAAIVKQPFSIRISLENVSATDTIANHYFYYEWEDAKDNNIYGTSGISGRNYVGTNLVPGQKASRTITWTPDTTGKFIFAVYDYAMTKYYYTDTITVDTASTVAPVITIDPEDSAFTATTGETKNFTVKVKNPDAGGIIPSFRFYVGLDNADADEDDENATSYLEDARGNELLYTTGNIAAGDSAVINVPWTPDSVGNYYLFVELENNEDSTYYTDDAIEVTESLVDPTAITSVKAEAVDDDTWYTISGARVARPAQRGLYIHKGKKVIIK